MKEKNQTLAAVSKIPQKAMREKKHGGAFNFRGLSHIHNMWPPKAQCHPQCPSNIQLPRYIVHIHELALIDLLGSASFAPKMLGCSTQNHGSSWIFADLRGSSWIFMLIRCSIDLPSFSLVFPSQDDKGQTSNRWGPGWDAKHEFFCSNPCGLTQIRGILGNPPPQGIPSPRRR